MTKKSKPTAQQTAFYEPPPISLLLAAAERGDLPEVERLLDQAENAPLWRIHGDQAFFRAVENGHAKVVEALIPVSRITQSVHRAIMHAARLGHDDVIRTIIPFATPHSIDDALCSAAFSGQTRTMRLLIALSKAEPVYDRALMSAARGGHFEAIKALLAYQKDIPIQGALHMAIRENRVDVARLLAQCPLTPQGMLDALVTAVSSKNDEVLRAMLPLLDTDADDYAALRLAISHKNLTAVNLLAGCCEDIEGLLERHPDLRTEPEPFACIQAEIDARALTKNSGDPPRPPKSKI